MIAANEATCMYMLPAVFSAYRKLFPAVQLQVNRSYGSRVVEAVMENVADFGLRAIAGDGEAGAGDRYISRTKCA